MSQETSGMQAPSAHAQLTLRTTQSHTAKVDQQKCIVIPFSFLPKPLDYSPWFLIRYLSRDVPPSLRPIHITTYIIRPYLLYSCVHINLSHNSFSTFKKLPKAPEVAELNLAGNAIASLSSLSSLSQYSRLTALTLTGNTVEFTSGYRSK